MNTVEAFRKRRDARIKARKDSETVQAYRERREARLKEREDTFEGHAGRKGKVGGSLPKHAGKAAEISQKVGFEVTASNAENFHDNFHKAKDAIAPRGKWRVDSTYTVQQYKEMECYNTSDGGSFAIHDGDIVSVCKGSITSGGALIDAAVAAGGNKLDAFDGIAGFYLSKGFEPVSWTPFNEEYAPDGWKESGCDAEDVVFFKYTGNVIPAEQRNRYMDEFKKKVPPCTGDDGYDRAKEIRDNSIKEGENEK